MSTAAIASRWRREALSLWGAPAQGLGRFSAWSFDTGELRLHVAHRLCDGALHAIHQSHPAPSVEAVCGFLLDRPREKRR